MPLNIIYYLKSLGTINESGVEGYPMIKVSLRLLSKEVDELDDFLNEIAPSPWLIIHDQIRSHFNLLGYFQSPAKFKIFSKILLVF